MGTRKEMKKRARSTVLHHYGILLVVCLLAAFFGTEFADSLDFVNLSTKSKTKTHEKILIDNTIESQGNELLHVVKEVLKGNLEQGEQEANIIKKNAVESSKESGNKVLGRSRGHLAEIVNGVTSGSIFVKIVRIFYQIGLSKDAIIGIVVIVVMIIIVGFWFLIKNTYKAVARRIFLECRTYERVTPQRFLFFIKARKWINVCVNMLMEYIFYFLWSLTIVGAVVKRYSYYMVPYIVAENPDIHWKDCINLSRKMMNGHKFECFVYELTFLWWDILGIVTLGLTDLFYANAYKTAFFSEYYTKIRSLAIENNIENISIFNDIYLFEKADTALLKEKYADVIKIREEVKIEPQYKGLRGFIEKNFGITLHNRPDEKRFQTEKERELAVIAAETAIEGKTYPDRLSPNMITQKKDRPLKIHYLRRYSVASLIFMFFIFSFLGWTWEVSIHLFKRGIFINRGVLHGPWLPIYGSGGILILVLLYRLRKWPILEFLATVLICGVVEYFTSYYLELTKGMRWWDYSGYFLNLNGRICAEGLFVFGVGGMALVYIVAPIIDSLFRRVNAKFTIIICIVLLTLFISDQIYSSKYPNSGKGIAKKVNTSVQLKVKS